MPIDPPFWPRTTGGWAEAVVAQSAFFRAVCWSVWMLFVAGYARAHHGWPLRRCPKHGIRFSWEWLFALVMAAQVIGLANLAFAWATNDGRIARWNDLATAILTQVIVVTAFSVWWFRGVRLEIPGPRERNGDDAG